MSLTLTLPEPPSANRYWRIFRNRAVRSKEADRYKAFAQEVASREWQHPPLTGPLVIIIEWYRKRRIGDLDNRLKVVIDALQGICYADDKQIEEIHAFRHDDKERPRLIVSVYQIDRTTDG